MSDAPGPQVDQVVEVFGSAVISWISWIEKRIDAASLLYRPWNCLELSGTVRSEKLLRRKDRSVNEHRIFHGAWPMMMNLDGELHWPSWKYRASERLVQPANPLLCWNLECWMKNLPQDVWYHCLVVLLSLAKIHQNALNHLGTFCGNPISASWFST